MAIIRECGGKMHMREQEWQSAFSDFFEAFKLYDEAGDPRRVSVLKYMVLASMLSQSEVDVFEAQETKAYANNAEIQAMTSLIQAYQARQVDEFLRILRRILLLSF